MAAAALFVDRRESTLNEAGDYLFAPREGAVGPDHIRGEIGELLIGAAEGRRSDSELTVFKSLGLAVEDLAAAEHVLAPRRGRGRRRRGRPLIPLEEILRARETIAGIAVRTPLVRLDVDSDAEIYLKLETLQPVNSFKIRGAGNAVLRRPTRSSRAASSPRAPGTWRRASPTRRGCAACRRRSSSPRARRRRSSPRSSASAAGSSRCPTTTGGACSSRGTTRAPTACSSTRWTTARVMAGNGTIGLELLEDLPDLDAVVVPYGGGGLVTGIASAVKASAARACASTRPSPRPARRRRTRSPRAARREVDYARSWVDGAGSRSLIPAVWEHVVRS